MPRGPRPMHPTVRARQNRTSTAAELEVLAPLDRARIDVPELPSDRLWDPRTSDFWRDAWQSPMRLEWDLADTHALLQLVYMLDMFWQAVDIALPGDHDDAKAMDRVAALKMKVDSITKLSQAIMNRSARLGIDPFARRSLQWLLVETEKAEAQRDHAKERTTASRERRAAAKKPKRPRGFGALE